MKIFQWEPTFIAEGREYRREEANCRFSHFS